MRVANEIWVPLRLHDNEKPLPPRHPLRAVYEIAATLTATFVIALVALVFVFRVARVDGKSMLPTLQDNAFLLTTAAPQPLRHGDIVVISEGATQLHKPIVKRVIGLPGDVIAIDFAAGVVYRNGQALIEDAYIQEPTHLFYPGMDFPLTVAPGTCFVMGDNRNRSEDSRSPAIGLVDQRYVLGRVLVH